ncbi:methyltransferase domain-containing protein [Gaiella sp.]|uniref:class I SAM-dependent methyltransferase n=1 Tax=Gaiella sp. TaxID=2663207 RepID=UPI003265DDE2
MSLGREERRSRATSFGDVADAYERSRPGYPDDAVRWLVGAEPLDVVDLGAGTGKLTRSLVALGHRVTAVEPLPEMIAHLRDAAPGLLVVQGGAEAIPLADESADVVVAAQAFHWFDHGPALSEIARVLRPGGRIALVWNIRDEREPWVAQLRKEALASEGFVKRDAATPVNQSGLFQEVERTEFPHTQRLDREELVDLVLSRSYCAVLSPEERAPVLDHVQRIFEEHEIAGIVELPYVTQCFRAPRR